MNEEPIDSSVYFRKLVDTVMSMLQSKCKYNPFGKLHVHDYILRLDFQHCGSPHAHILLRLENNPKVLVGEVTPQTVSLLMDLCSESQRHQKRED